MAPGDPQGVWHQLLWAISSLSSLISPRWEISLLSAQILSTQEGALCQWGCLLCGELASHFGSELIGIYLKCEHLSEAADGGSRVELPAPRAGSISFKCEAGIIYTQLTPAPEASEEEEKNKRGHLCARFGRSQLSWTESSQCLKDRIHSEMEGNLSIVPFWNIFYFFKA